MGTKLLASFFMFVFLGSCLGPTRAPSTVNIDSNRIQYMNELKNKTVSIRVQCMLDSHLAVFKDGTLSIIPHKIPYRGRATGIIFRSFNKHSYVVTAHHVIAKTVGNKCSELSVQHSYDFGQARKKFPFKVVMKYPRYDLALLRVKASFGVSTRLAKNTYEGQRALAIGFPKITFPSVFKKRGVVVSVSISEGVIATSIFVKGILSVIRFSGAIYFGSSGGGLFDSRGSLIGIASYIYGGPAGRVYVPVQGNSYFVSSDRLVWMLKGSTYEALLN